MKADERHIIVGSVTVGARLTGLDPLLLEDQLRTLNTHPKSAEATVKCRRSAQAEECFLG